jgi:ABC-2 type transport system ATP-binding protein
VGLTHRYPAATPRRRGRSRAGAAAPVADRPALDRVSFDIRPGEVFGVLGPNGGGKTTLFRILATMLRAASGRVEVFGHDAAAEPHRVREQLGVVFQLPSRDNKLTARENLVHQGHLYGLRGRELHDRIDALLAGVSLRDRQHERVELFSGGMRRRVELVKAMLHGPRLLVLDEPATGLDPGARRDVWQLLEALRARDGVTVALTTHLMEEADRCDRLAILARGRLVALDTPSRLKAAIGGDVITLEPEAGEGAAGADGVAALARDIAERFGHWPAGSEPAVVDGRIRLGRDDGAAFVARLASAFPGRLRRLTVGRPTLEDVFMHMTGQSLWETARDADESVARVRG